MLDAQKKNNLLQDIKYIWSAGPKATKNAYKLTIMVGILVAIGLLSGGTLLFLGALPAFNIIMTSTAILGIFVFFPLLALSECIKSSMKNTLNNYHLSSKNELLPFAAENGILEGVKYLIKQDVYVDTVINHIERVSYAYTYENGYESRIPIPDESKYDSSRANTDKTGLILAAENGHTDIVQYLIEYGANVKVPQREYPRTLNVAIINPTIKAAQKQLKAELQSTTEDALQTLPTEITHLISDYAQPTP